MTDSVQPLTSPERAVVVVPDRNCAPDWPLDLNISQKGLICYSFITLAPVVITWPFVAYSFWPSTIIICPKQHTLLTIRDTNTTKNVCLSPVCHVRVPNQASSMCSISMHSALKVSAFHFIIFFLFSLSRFFYTTIWQCVIDWRIPKAVH